jgi:hypothetical protein
MSVTSLPPPPKDAVNPVVATLFIPVQSAILLFLNIACQMCGWLDLSRDVRGQAGAQVTYKKAVFILLSAAACVCAVACLIVALVWPKLTSAELGWAVGTMIGQAVTTLIAQVLALSQRSTVSRLVATQAEAEERYISQQRALLDGV